MSKNIFGKENLNVREVTTEFRMKHCDACAYAASKNLIGTSEDCPQRGSFHGENQRAFWGLTALARFIMSTRNGLVLRTHNLISNVGHAGANGRMSNQGAYSPFVNLGLGTGAETANALDQALSDEITASGGARAAATASQVTTTVTNDTTQLVHTWSFTGSFAITEEGIFDAAIAPTVTTLNGAITNVVTAIAVTSGTGITNNDYVQIDNEILQVTAGGGTTSLTVTRGQKGTTAASHLTLAGVVDINTSGNMLAKQTFSVINVNNGDSLQVTHKYQS